MKKRSRVRRSRPDINLAVLRSFRVIYGSVRAHFRQVERSCGVSGSQLWMLHELSRNAGIGITELAARLSIHQSTRSLLVDKLVRAGHVTKIRSREDRRQVRLRISKRGLRVLARAPGPPEGVLPEAVAGLSRAKLLSLHAGLRSVIAGLDVKDESAAGQLVGEL